MEPSLPQAIFVYDDLRPDSGKSRAIKDMTATKAVVKEADLLVYQGKPYVVLNRKMHKFVVGYVLTTTQDDFVARLKELSDELEFYPGDLINSDCHRSEVTCYLLDKNGEETGMTTQAFIFHQPHVIKYDPVLGGDWMKKASDSTEADVLYIKRILDPNDNMDFEVINLQYWRQEMKRVYRVIIDHGSSAEQFFEAIRYKNSLLENINAAPEETKQNNEVATESKKQ